MKDERGRMNEDGFVKFIIHDSAFIVLRRNDNA